MTLDLLDVHRAIKSGEFFPYFQPLVRLRTVQLVGFEVLARWKRPGIGMVAPDQFIPLAERDGWIDELMETIIHQAFTAGSALPEPLYIAVNISPVQLRDSNLPTEIERLSNQTGFPLSRVFIEITETALADNLEHARSIAIKLKELGCRIGLDDFGTGYSSLRHLQALPFDELKVDRSFVSSMGQRRESRKIVSAVLGLGQSLGLTTVGEGIESKEQAEMLLWMGCDVGQGWLFGKPVPAEELGAAVSAHRERILDCEGASWLSDSSLEGLPAQRLAQLQAVYNGAPVGLGFLDSKLRYVNLNHQLAAMHGLPVADHLGRTAAEIMPEFDQGTEASLQRALNGEFIAGLEFTQSARESRSERTFLASYSPAVDEAGEVVGISVAVADFTDRKKAEETLRQYERVVEGLDEMIAVVDRNYRYVLANGSFLSHRKLKREELIGRTIYDRIGMKAFDDLIKPKLDQCLAGNVVKFDLTYNYPELGEREFSVIYIPIEVAGDITGAACVIRDVTDLRRMSEANENWQQRMELAQNAGLGLGLWDWDLESNTVVWSDETYRHTGFTRENFSGRVEDALQSIHPEDREKVQSAVDAVLSGKDRKYHCEYRLVRPDGSTIWLDAHGIMVPGRSPHMLGVGIDITETMQVKESLRVAEEMYLLLLNSTGQGIYGVDLKGDCTFCNPAALRFLGYETVSELLGKNMHWVAHHTHANGEHYPIEKCRINEAIRTGTFAHVTDEVIWRADTTCFPVEYWSYPMRRHGEIVGAVVSFLDKSGGNVGRLVDEYEYMDQSRERPSRS